LAAQLPEQQNGSDCGVFLLQYVEGFCRNPPTLYTKEDLKVTVL
jgi:Ulp1 family protease